ncbi:forkhead-associated (FHA) domain-containing protein [Striga asiatica]|uniref:Forkhead-associated (FHA) domain-containing protein n=1 Tax=Striga asiatica TaxID=4170 RepID=A0A5A7PRX7_STRAF|nr:forkhead-associated (FHA) domain-containing protein [Striga asiatica]
MLEVMRSEFSPQPRSNKSEAVKEAALTSGKRKKAENIRKCYYAMCKRICNVPLDIMGIDLLPGSSATNFGDENGLGIQDPDFDIGPHLFPEFGPNSSNDLQFGGQVAAHDLPPFTYEDSTLPEFNQSDLFGPEAHLEGPGFGACDSGPYRNLACSSSTMPQMSMWDDSTSPDMCAPSDQLMARDEFVIPPSCNVNVTDSYLAELSNTLFSDDLHCSDSSPKDGIDASYLEGLSSLLTFDASPSQIELDGTAGGPHLLCEEPDKAASPIRASKELGPEYTNGVICCTLNTEDPNIPDNDDVFLPVRLPSPSFTPSGFHWKFEDPIFTKDLTNVARKVKVKVGPPAMKNNGQKDPCGPSRIEVATGPLDKGSIYSVADKGVKFELPKSNIQQAVLRNVRKGEGYSSRASSANTNENCTAKESSVDVDQGKKVDCEHIEICLDKREHGVDILESLEKSDNVKAETSNVGLVDDEPSCRKTIALPIDESLVLDMEEWSENDVPCFSDVEAMILDMDLSPDLYTNPEGVRITLLNLIDVREVQRYMLEESKKAIMRLEQSADSCTQRTFARQGAFAVLYGRWSKHFIKKPEVILGRSTEESKVDIDLGREKNGGKISRRQAIIKMDMHGTFQLINVGKSWVYVNGKEVLPCQSLSLTSGCLIEVRGLAFIFETSRANINIYLNSIVGSNLKGS